MSLKLRFELDLSIGNRPFACERAHGRRRLQSTKNTHTYDHVVDDDDDDAGSN